MNDIGFDFVLIENNYLKIYDWLWLTIIPGLIACYYKFLFVSDCMYLHSLFLGGASTCICHFFCLCLSFCCAPYLWNPTSCDHNFWYARDDVSRSFSFSKIFWFFGPLRAKNSPKWKIKIASVMCHIPGKVWHLIMIFGTCV